MGKLRWWWRDLRAMCDLCCPSAVVWLAGPVGLLARVCLETHREARRSGGKHTHTNTGRVLFVWICEGAKWAFVFQRGGSALLARCPKLAKLSASAER